MDIFAFALFTKFEESLNFLANSLAYPEGWEYSNPDKEIAEGNNSARYSFPILRNYLEHTFRKLSTEDKIVFTPDKKFSCFNTGLVTSNYEEIFAFFEENKSYNKQSPYFFKAFLKESDREFLTYFSGSMPESANYFYEPAKLIFNPTFVIKKNIDHIINDSKYRFPETIRNASNREIRNHLVGALDEISKKVKTNYKLGIPQYYNGKIQLLLPLYFSDSNVADLALTIEQINDTSTYIADACLTTGMAYNNARLIVKPESDWLKP